MPSADGRWTRARRSVITDQESEPEELYVKFKLWIETPDGERVWLDDYLKNLPPGSQVSITEKGAQNRPTGPDGSPVADGDPES